MQKIPLSLVLVASLAHADSRIELGAALGGHAFSGNGELGVDDDMTLPGPKSSVAVGARAAYLVMPRLAVEGEALAIPTKDNALGDGALALGMRAHARFDVLTGRLRPFVVGGVGMHVLRPSSPMMKSDADQSFHWGAGVHWALTDLIDLRVDARHLIVPDRTLDGATSDFELTAGVTYHLGATSRRPLAAAPAVPPGIAITTAPDRDMDTIPDATDKCPSEPEDVDSFEDNDGCPELDNDGDSIPDVDDVCPTDKETKNNVRDDDGCPDQAFGGLAPVQFDAQSAKLDDAALDAAHKQLTDFPGLFVEVSGHTAAGEANAMDLSLKRAETVKAALVKRGIAASRILTVGHGADVPVGNDARKSRRVEFRLMTPDEVPAD